MRNKVNHSGNGKFLNIEILRIIGCISVVFIHLFHQYLYDIFKDIELYGKLASCTGNGNKAVDMFFMISGFLFSLKLNLEAISSIAAGLNHELSPSQLISIFMF